MDKEEIKVRMEQVFRRTLNNRSIVLVNDLSAADVEGWDSLSHMLLIAEIEREFEIKFKLKDLSAIRNVGDIIDIVFSRI